MGEKRSKAERDDAPRVEDTQPLIPGYPTRRDVVRFARELLDGKNPPPPDSTPPKDAP